MIITMRYDYYKISGHKFNLVKVLLTQSREDQNSFTIINPDNFSITELEDVDLYSFETNNYLNMIRLVYLKKNNKNNHEDNLFDKESDDKRDHWKNLFGEKSVEYEPWK
jgi:hypothetical protein